LPDKSIGHSRDTPLDTVTMRMSRKVAVFLLGLAAFMIVQWVMLAFNMQPGRPTAFYVVHGTLIVVNLVLAVVLGVIGWRGLRSS
jgi:hypothetical protein